jgi:hypothetical protein
MAMSIDRCPGRLRESTSGEYSCALDTDCPAFNLMVEYRETSDETVGQMIRDAHESREAPDRLPD